MKIHVFLILTIIILFLDTPLSVRRGMNCMKEYYYQNSTDSKWTRKHPSVKDSRMRVCHGEYCALKYFRSPQGFSFAFHCVYPYVHKPNYCKKKNECFKINAKRPSLQLYRCCCDRKIKVEKCLFDCCAKEMGQTKNPGSWEYNRLKTRYALD